MFPESFGEIKNLAKEELTLTFHMYSLDSYAIDSLQMINDIFMKVSWETKLCFSQDQLYDLWNPMHNENVDLWFKTIARVSGGWQQSIRHIVGSSESHMSLSHEVGALLSPDIAVVS